MKMFKTPMILIVALFPACIAGSQFTGAASDHAIQTRAVAESCKSEGYGYGKCTAEDLEAMALQAECILAIVESRNCGE